MEKQSIQSVMDLTGKTAIVTGAGGGIGLGAARRLHEAGANVAIVDLNGDLAEQAAADLNGLRPDSAIAITADVADEQSTQGVVETTTQQFSNIDILVNNAGIFPFKTLAQMTAQDFDKVIAVNLRSVFLLTKQVSEAMKQQGRGGKIINIASIDALHPSMAGLAAYDASKHGVWGFTKNVALELAEHKIWVNAVAPGGVLTPGVVAMQGGQASQESTVPMKRIGDPDDIGKVVLFLASNLASYMTGSLIVADGGALLQ